MTSSQKLKISLKSFLLHNQKRKSAQVESNNNDNNDRLRLFEAEYKAICQIHYDSILPHFYFPTEVSMLKLKLREEARAKFLQSQSNILLNNDELKAFYALLDTEADALQQTIDYAAFKSVSIRADRKFSPFLTVTVFAKLLQDDPSGKISIMSLFNYVMRKVWLYQTRIGLSLYDINGNGNLTEPDLENYIGELMDTLPQLNDLEKSFHSFYICTAVRKFFFFLDPYHTGRVRVQDVLACGFLDELLELRDEELTKELMDKNWFSAASALKVYGIYLNLDVDHNGMLSREELQKYSTGTLTQAFINRVFEEYLTFEGEMDYKTYLDFVLALENRKEPQSLHFFFRILDVRQSGFLDAFSLNYFFRDILREMKKHNQEPVRFEDVKDEIFDMVRPSNHSHITLDDLISSGQGDTVVSILIDLNGFWTYENREILVSDVLEERGADQFVACPLSSEFEAS